MHKGTRRGGGEETLILLSHQQEWWHGVKFTIKCKFCVAPSNHKTAFLFRDIS